MRVVHTETELADALQSPEVFVFSGQHTRKSDSLLGWLRSDVFGALARAARRILAGGGLIAFLPRRPDGGDAAANSASPPHSSARPGSSLADPHVGPAGGPLTPASIWDVLDRLADSPAPTTGDSQ